MRPIRSELIKLLKARSLWVVMGITTIILGVYAYQYTLNTGSGIMAAELSDPALLSSMLVLAYVAVYCIPVSVTAGSLVVGQEYSARTMASLVVVSGRQRPVWSKVAAVLMVQVVLVLTIVAEGMVWGLAVGGTLIRMEALRLLMQILIGVGVGFTVSIAAMAVASISKSTATSALLCLAVLLGIALFLSDNSLATKVLPVFPWGKPIDHWFSSLDGVKEANVYQGTPDGALAVVWILAYPMILLGIQVLVARYREHGTQA